MQLLQEEHGYSQRRACRVTNCHRTTARHTPRRSEDAALRTRLREWAQQKKSWGYRMLGGALRLEGWKLNHKRAYRIYKEEKLDLRPKHRKRIKSEKRGPSAAPQAINEVWTMDFTSDRLCDGRSFRTLNVIDIFTRRCLGIEVDTSLSSERAASVWCAFWSESRRSSVGPSCFKSTMVRSSEGRSWISGPRRTGWSCTSLIRANRNRTGTSKASMVAFERNA